MARSDFRTIVVGGGPAGFAPLVAASREGRLDQVLSDGVAFVERGPFLGSGNLGSYGIMSDSTAATFLTAIEDHMDPRLGRLQETSICAALRALGRGPAPLDLTAKLMELIGVTLAQAIIEAGGRVLIRHEGVSAQRSRTGCWRVRVRPVGEGNPIELTCETLVIATGGQQSRQRLATESFAGAPLLPRHADRVLLSDEVLRRGGQALVAERIVGRSAPRIVIAGASTSALAVANLLLRTQPSQLGDDGCITVLHRRPPRIFYPSAEAALAEDYDSFGPDDICPISGFVFRLAGFREDSRELAMSMLGVGKRPPEPRARFQDIDAPDHAETQAVLDEADLIVAALGYRPNLLALAEHDGSPIALAGLNGRPAVDGFCRVLNVRGEPVDGVYGLGLAAGFRPSGRFGGERSFKGQANGLWLWQNAVGSSIVDAMLATGLRATASAAE